MSLNNEPCIIRPTIIDLNPVELNYYPFMINLDKLDGSCSAVDYLSTKICVPSKTKDVNGKVFNIITRVNEAKTLVKHISCDCKRKFKVCLIQLRNRIMINLNVNVKIIVSVKKIIVGILAHVFVGMVRI